MARACVAIEMCECVSTARVRGGGLGRTGGVPGPPSFFASFPVLPFPTLLSCPVWPPIWW